MRSFLFIPANNPGMLQNADVFMADSVIFDLEDAVNVREKDSARILLKNFLHTFTLDVNVVIRINAFDSEYFHEDLKNIVSDKIDSLMIPKANVEDLVKIGKLLEKFEQEHNLKKQITLIPIIESADAVIEVEKIAKVERVSGLLLGAEDLSSDLEIERTKAGDEILYPRARLIYAALAKKIIPIDTPFTDVTDFDGLKEDCKKAKSLGMKAKAAIHPNQIAYINEIFAPSEKQINYALRVIKASETEQKGVFSLDGKMVDKPIIERAQKILAQARKYDLL